MPQYKCINGRHYAMLGKVKVYTGSGKADVLRWIRESWLGEADDTQQAYISEEA